MSRKYDDLTELLQCHTKCIYKYRQFPTQAVSLNVFQAEPDKPAFASDSGIKRSTLADVKRILGSMTSVVSDDDKTDQVYTADDVEQFDERKRLAKELDRIIGDVIVSS